MLPSILPAKLARSLEPFDDKDWLFELKHDGFRSLAYVESGKCRLVSRRRNQYKSFEVLRNALEGLRAQIAILDGEIVALDSSGVSQFKELLYRRGKAVSSPGAVARLDINHLRAYFSPSLPSGFLAITLTLIASHGFLGTLCWRDFLCEPDSVTLSSFSHVLESG